jgi:predicted unusual protein kinase regulating ubiquinone biosynthesis (AarF/ABC1/UbiB family)
MLSLQDTTVLPVEWSKALDNLRNKADAMPEEELKEIFKREWGVGIEDVNGGNVVGFNRRVEEGGLGEGADRDHWLLDYCSIPDSHVLKMSTSGSPVTVGDIKSIRPQAFASASIGQVHLATLKDDSHLILKVQYPDILTSITNDIANLQGLIRYMNVVPKGVFLDSIIEQGVREVEGECDYEREQRGMARYRSLLEGGERPALRATLVGEGFWLA